MAVNYTQLVWLGSVEILITLFALGILGLDLRVRGGRDLAWRRRLAAGVGILGCLLGVVWLWVAAPEGVAPGGMLTSNALTRMVQAVVLLLAAGSLALGSGQAFTEHVGEYAAVLLFGTVGMLLMVAASNTLMLFLSLELASVALYILLGFARHEAGSMEASLKTFIFGSMAAAFLLFGLSLVQGLGGAAEFGRLGTALSGADPGPLLWVGLAMVLAGLGFKVAAAPFHFWAPDAYQGAPTVSAGFLATASKVAAFFLVAKFSLVGLRGVGGSAAWGGLQPGWYMMVAGVATASMLWGNLGALNQRNVKRLLAYSGVAHAGYMLVAVVSGGPGSLASTTFYAVTYAVTTLGTFGVVSYVERVTGGSDFRHFAGLSRRSPGLALCLGLFVLSLAGIPPLAGFFAKFLVFLGALRAGPTGSTPGLLWLVGLGAATTCVSFYYYLRLLKVVFVEESIPAEPLPAVKASLAERLTVGAAALVVIPVGCLPAVLLGPLERALAAMGTG